MGSNFNEIFDYKVVKTDTDKNKVFSVISNELAKFNFEEDYLKEGNLEIVSCSEIKFHTCTIENFTDTRSISETNRPNRGGVAVGNKRILDFNSWDYKLSYIEEFQNSEDNHSIEESHHAIGCRTCKQHGKIRCSHCGGAGDRTCSSCSGRGESKCGSCSGRGEIQCRSCSGKGTKKNGDRTERCSSCHGRGYQPCSKCRNGYITCSRCSGQGRVTCGTCRGSGEVTCHNCDGYRTMDHYFIVNAKFTNLYQNLFVTNPYPGFDVSKAIGIGFSMQKKLFEFKENRFKEGYFEQLKSHPLFRQICSFFDFENSEKTKLISSRITFYENRYNEVIFSFYGDRYTIYLDQRFEKSYYSGKKPSDQYELDLLKKSLNSANNNELEITKKTIQKLSNYDFININDKYLISAIEDTQNIYEAKNEIDDRNYRHAERALRLVSEEKKNENDYEKLIKHLNKIYFTNTTIVGLLCFIGICFKLIDKNTQFTTSNIAIALGIISFSLLINRIIRNIHWSRWFVLLLFGIQFFRIVYFEKKEGASIRSEKAIRDEFLSFKNSHYTVFNGQDSIILIEPTGAVIRNYFLPKGKPFKLDVDGSREIIAESKIYLNIEQQSFEKARGSDKVTVELKVYNDIPSEHNIEVNYNDITYDVNDNAIEVRFIYNTIEAYMMNNAGRLFIPKSSWQAIQNGAKSIEATAVKQNFISTPAFSNSYWDSIPPPVGWVNEEIFTPEEERRLDSLIQDFENRTTVEIAIITIPKSTIEEGKFEELTLRIAQTWGVGKKETNNGILIGISTGYRRIRIQNGFGIEEQMSNEQTKQILDEIYIPNAKVGDYYTGTFNTIQAIKQILEKGSLND